MTVGQAWDPSEYARNARFVSELGVDLVALLAPKPGERVLDLGCGDGALTKKLLEAGCSVVGVDSSPELVSAAQAYGVDAHVARAESLPYESEFDAVFSNAVLHWVPDLAAPIRSIHRALRPNGRFVAEMGGEGNIAGIRSAIYSALEHRSVSAAAGTNRAHG